MVGKYNTKQRKSFFFIVGLQEKLNIVESNEKNH